MPRHVRTISPYDVLACVQQRMTAEEAADRLRVVRRTEHPLHDPYLPGLHLPPHRVHHPRRAADGLLLRSRTEPELPRPLPHQGERMNNTPITVVGNLTADPELRFTPSGAAVANFTVASTPRTFDKQTQEFKDGETLFMRCSVWREQAEHVSESLHRGDRVVVTGSLVSRSWQTQEGENRSVMEMQVDEIGPSLRYATAQATKAQRGNQGNQGGWGGQGQQQPDPWKPQEPRTDEAPF